MASNLLKTFKKIDIDRKLIIQLLNSSGLNIPENGSFGDIIDALTTFELPNEFNINLEWKRPNYWPDPKEIYKNAPKYEGYYPYAVAIMDNTLDSIIMPFSSKTSIRLIHTSDGTIYRYNNVDEPIEHTWDTTKDIIIDEENPMRYVILYASLSDLTKYLSPVCYSSGTYNDIYSPLYKANKEDKGWGNCIVEWFFDVIDDIQVKTSSSSPYIKLPYNSSNSTNTKVSCITTTNNFIEKMKIGVFEVNSINTFYNLKYLNTYVNNNSSAGFKDIKLSKYINTNSNANLATNKSVVYAEYPYVVSLIGNSGNQCGSEICDVRLPNLEIFSPNFSLYAKTLYAPRLKTLNRTISISSNILYLPALESSNTITYDAVPIVILPNLKTLTGIIASSTNYKPAHTILVPSLTSISNSNAFNLEGLINLEVGEGFNSTINLNKTNLSKISILNLFNNLAEVDANSGLTITLGTTLLSFLTEEEKAIATNKGWVLK